jgi:hypothetical protein
VANKISVTIATLANEIFTEDTETDEDDHSSESLVHSSESHDQSHNVTSPNSVGLAQKSTFNSPLSHMHHSSASFVPPYGHINNMAPVSHMVPPNPFVPLMPPFPSSGFPPPVTIDET